MIFISQACGNWETNDGTVVKYSLDSVKNLIQNGFVPVLHGDCVLDHAKGCAILSGDTIIQVKMLIYYFPLVSLIDSLTFSL